MSLQRCQFTQTRQRLNRTPPSTHLLLPLSVNFTSSTHSNFNDQSTFPTHLPRIHSSPALLAPCHPPFRHRRCWLELAAARYRCLLSFALCHFERAGHPSVAASSSFRCFAQHLFFFRLALSNSFNPILIHPFPTERHKLGRRPSRPAPNPAGLGLEQDRRCLPCVVQGRGGLRKVMGMEL